MNPILEDRWIYTVNSSHCCGRSSNIKAPDISIADQPQGITNRQWQDLQQATFAGCYLQRRLLRLLVIFVLFLVASAVYIVSIGVYRLNEKAVSYITMALIFIPEPFLTDALLGCWRMPGIRRAIEGLRPVFRSQGYELEFRTEGRIFFVIGIVTIARSQYQPQIATGEMAIVVLEEQEICQQKQLPPRVQTLQTV